MAKIINQERLTIVFVLTREGGTAPVKVEGRADYEVDSEDLQVPRSIPLQLSAAQETALKSFGGQALEQVKSAEGIN